MPDSIEQPEPTRLLQALTKVSQSVMEDVLQKARQFHTDIIIADSEGQPMSLSPDAFEETLKTDSKGN